MNNFPEPPINPFDDTQPNITIRPPSDETGTRAGMWGTLSLVGAGVLMLATFALVLSPSPTPPPNLPQIDSTTLPQSLPTQTPEQAPATVTDALPSATLSTPSNAGGQTNFVAANIDALLLTPLPTAFSNPVAEIAYDPFTIIPERPRSEFTEYKAVSGDTIDAIAKRYNLKPETLAWCNDRRIVFTLRPGDVLQIPPVDGACHLVLGTRNESIAGIAEQYQVSANQLINSPFANLYDRAPEDVLPGGTRLFIADGQGEIITWQPPSETQTDATGTIISYAFARGQAGSCGSVAPGGGAAWGNPLPNGTWMRGFSVGHSGIDLAAPEGTPIYAANSGPVLFSGFSNWGYGQTVVLAHGPFSTLYGHMFARSVSCGQFVSVGQVVGTVGSTGNSTGPHLHFEIRYADQPQDPSGTPGIGW